MDICFDPHENVDNYGWPLNNCVDFSVQCLISVILPVNKSPIFIGLSIPGLEIVLEVCRMDLWFPSKIAAFEDFHCQMAHCSSEIRSYTNSNHT